MDLLWKPACRAKMTMDNSSEHERFTRLLLEVEPVMLRSILVVVPNRSNARDILQQTAVALWRQFDSYDPKRPFLNWAMGFARVETRRFLAREKRLAQLSEEAVAVLQGEMDGTLSFVGEVERHLTTCLQKLGEKQRRLIHGYYHEGRSPQWLAEQGRGTVEAVYKSIQRTRRELKLCIERQTRRELT